jgi:MtN3 and saliva related transmembrane protein
MDLEALTILGLVAACCTTFAFVPQVAKAWRTRSTADISLGMFGLMTFGIVLWLVYGAFKSDVPLVLANLVTLGLSSTILYLKLRHG